MTFEVIDDPAQPNWQLRIEPTTTIVEVAALLQALGTGAILEFQPDRQAVFTPLNYGAPKPTVQQIRDILEHGVPKLPNLRIVTRSI